MRKFNYFHLQHFAYFMSVMPFCIFIAAVFFMPESVPVHFDKDGIANRFGSNNEYIAVGALLGFVSLIMSLAFDYFKFSRRIKIFGFVASALASATFIILEAKFINKVFDYTVAVTPSSAERITAFAFSLSGILLLTVGIVKFSTSKFNPSCRILYAVYALGGSILAISSAVMNNYDYVMISVPITALVIALTFILRGRNPSKK